MLWFLLGLAVALAVGWICVYTFLQCFYSPKDRNIDPYKLIEGEQYEELAEVITDCTRVMDKAPCQWVSITSRDGLTLHGRYYHTRDRAPTAIAFHGYKSSALRDGCGGFALSRKHGFNILVPDQRAHAKSEGNVITFGIKERWDCLSWIEYVNQRFGSDLPILLSGLSMGAATVLMAADLPLPKNVVGIMADCPYSSPAEIIRKVCADRGFPEKAVFPFIRLSARLLGGFPLMETSAFQAVQHANVPVLLIHGDDDRFVPCDMSREIAAHCASPVQLEIFPGAGHGLSYMTDPERYEAVALTFFKSLPELAPYLEE